MSVLAKQLLAVMRTGMSVPVEFYLLFDWMEQTGRFIDGEDGNRCGVLVPHPSEGYFIGTCAEFIAEGNRDLHYRFGHSRKEVLDRLCVFATIGGDGTRAAFWLDDEGKQCIVIMGSGSMMSCVLAENAVDFLRLLAIGYPEIGNSCDELGEPPETVAAAWQCEPKNHQFIDWVTTTFGVVIPRLGIEIVRHPAEFGDQNTPDRFCRWLNRNVE